MCFQLCVCVFSWRLGSGVRGPGSEGGVAKVWGMLLDMLACFFSCREAGMGRGAAPPPPPERAAADVFVISGRIGRLGRRGMPFFCLLTPVRSGGHAQQARGVCRVRVMLLAMNGTRFSLGGTICSGSALDPLPSGRGFLARLLSLGCGWSVASYQRFSRHSLACFVLYVCFFGLVGAERSRAARGIFFFSFFGGESLV